MFSRALTVCCLILFYAGTALPAELMVNESAREIPVAYDVDVVVVGGSTGAVSAAVAAAESGAKVFLAARHPYLGDDMTATLRLWLEEGETPTSPLALRLFSDTVTGEEQSHPNRMAYTYKADVKADPKHAETRTGNRLTDGGWSSASQQSVQYNGDVNIVADLGKEQDIDRVRILAFHRDSSEDGFKVAQIDVSASADGETWQPITEIKKVQVEGNERSSLAADINTKARYLKFGVKKADDAERVLLGEIEIIKPGDPAAPQVVDRPKPPRPMHVKKTLDEVLLAAGVEFLYNCYPTDVLTDGEGRPCGIVMANRAGRQAVVARTIIDATPRAVIARLAGAKSRPYPAGEHTFQRVVIGGDPVEAANTTSRVIDPPFLGPFPNAAKTASGEFKVIEYTIHLPMEDGSYASWAAAEQKARTLTYHIDQQFTSDDLFEIPPDPLHGATPVTGAGQGGAADLPLGAFRPADVKRVFVLGGCADVPRDVAARIMRPLALIDLGQRIGEAAAVEATSTAKPVGVELAGRPVETPAVAGDIREFLTGVRPLDDLPTVPQEARGLPVLGKYDVVVIGGGTAGAPAGIGSGRRGAKTLLVEHLHALGGVGTTGYISSYYWGNKVGFTATVPGGGRWVPDQKAEWWRNQNLQAGTELWFGSIGCGALVNEDRVVGAVVTTPLGRGVVLANVVIDTTGNADIAAAAGADTIYTDESEFGMQGTGLPPRKLGATYTNTDFSIVDETDLKDVWHFYVYAKQKYATAFDQGQLIDTRERRRIVGEYTVTFLDQLLGRTFPDSIVRPYSNFDTHGYTVDPLFEVSHPDKRGFYVYVPYRCSIPKGLEGILVGGLGVSSQRDAIPLIRMQADMQNQGYALGFGAAMVSETDSPIRHLNVEELQQHLVEIGNLPEDVLTHEDSMPLPDDKIAAAVAKLATPEDAGAILTSPERALPLLRQAYATATENERKIRYAHMLAVLDDDAGVKTLIDEVSSHEELDAGWNYRGMGQFGNALSHLDTLIVALGRTGNSEALPAILEKTKLLSYEIDFSHHRACGLALELIGDPSAAKPLAELLRKESMMGWVHDTVATAGLRDLESPGGTNAVRTRRDSFCELLLARALYRCGDYEGLGEQILRAYTKDLRGHLARHAQAVLDAGKP